MAYFCFTLFTDVQYADRPVHIGRYYRNAIKKASACIDAINQSQADFCVHLGDLIDCTSDPAQGKTALTAMLSVLDRCYLPSVEVGWLRENLRGAEPDAVVVLVHALLDDMKNPHVIGNAGEIRAILILLQEMEDIHKLLQIPNFGLLAPVPRWSPCHGLRS